jgi:DNA-binding response OmpR family regulator
VRAVLRRSRQTGGGKRETALLRFGDLEIEPLKREIRVGGSPVRLTPKEFELLHFLASHPGVVFSRYQLLDELWDIAFGGDPSTVTVHVRRLREKIERDPSSPRHLITAWRAGYRFDP